MLPCCKLHDMKWGSAFIHFTFEVVQWYSFSRCLCRWNTSSVLWHYHGLSRLKYLRVLKLKFSLEFHSNYSFSCQKSWCCCCSRAWRQCCWAFSPSAAAGCCGCSRWCCYPISVARWIPCLLHRHRSSGRASVPWICWRSCSPLAAAPPLLGPSCCRTPGWTSAAASKTRTT